jgi:type III pantothenate kinase
LDVDSRPVLVLISIPNTHFYAVVVGREANCHPSYYRYFIQVQWFFDRKTRPSPPFMNVCVDIGNSRVKIGLFQQKILLDQCVWEDWTVDQIVAFGRQHGAQKVIFSSVIQHDPSFERCLRENFQTIELTSETALPFENRYDTPETLGKDRLAAVAGAHALFPGTNNLVIDCGTCIKYDLLTSDGVYLGGNIAPGANMRIQAMHHFTARLPLVPMEIPRHFIGKSTTTALQNGALRGACLEITGTIGLFEQEYAPLHVVLTGGDALFFEPYLTLPGGATEPDLTLYGLNNILIFNT